MIRLPYRLKAKYTHHRQRSPKEFDQGSFKTVPLHHTKYRGKKFKKWKRAGSGAKARVAKHKKTHKYVIQSILIPKTPQKQYTGKNIKEREPKKKSHKKKQPDKYRVQYKKY